MSLIIMFSFSHLLKTLVLIEIAVVSVLFLFILTGSRLGMTRFLVIMALAALEAGLGFSLLVKLLRLYGSPRRATLINL